ncbi:ATP-binding protein [Candidatus Nanosynbacter sp. TM7-053]|uniref:ATP-binding protein n=1 Tax=Candidatus Nanosynbacter sp. TM7-053 TaxID=2902634 RepID=UPI001FB5D160|nr:ATP-binding protein [Candidatus Nanosynbacter sp. TM7-053]MCJ1965397.1 ATP-binding protein [Candidatus Nanosynbacter sp. TM7-053]
MKKGGIYFKPHAISRFWLRRLCEVALLSCFTIILLYAWARFIPTGYQLPIGLSVSDLAAGVAGIGSLIVLILCFWLPRKHETGIGIFVYLLTVAVTATTIITSGGVVSPFLVMWIIVAIFAGFFGAIILGIMGLLVILQIIATSVQQGVNIQFIIGYLFFGFLPLIFSLVLWIRRQKTDDNTSSLENKLSAVESKSDVVINAIDDGVLAISKDGNIELINPSAQQIIGWNQGDALGLNWKSVLKLVTSDGKDVEDLENPIAQSLSKNQPTHNDKLFLLTSSEKRILVSIVSSPVGTDGEGIIVVFRDITKEKAEEREQAEFISTASHEMRTPVASIEGYLGLALNPATAHIDEKARDFITKAHESAQHLGRLFQDLLDISKVEDGRMKNNPKVINVNEFLKDIFDGLATKANEKQLNYIFMPDIIDEGKEKSLQPIFYANIDPDHFREVVSNLIENAIKYTPSGEVVVNITGDDKQISVSVKDSGIGIPAEDIPHLFQKFYRVDNSDTREIGGTGLGLYLSRRLAEAMSGNLRVESKYKEGSTFYLEIPRMNSSEAKQRLESTEAESSKDSMSDSTVPEEIEIAAEEKTEDMAIENNSEIVDSNPATIATPENPAPAAPAAPTTQPEIPQPARNSSEPTLAEIEEELRKKRQQLSIPGRE